MTAPSPIPPAIEPAFSNEAFAALSPAAAASRVAARRSAPITAPIAPRAATPPTSVEGRDSATRLAIDRGFSTAALSAGKNPCASSTCAIACCISGEYSAVASSAHFPNWRPVFLPSQSAALEIGLRTPDAAANGAAAISPSPVAIPGICNAPRFRPVPISPIREVFCFFGAP